MKVRVPLAERFPSATPTAAHGWAQLASRAAGRSASRREPRLVGLAYASPALILYSSFVIIPFCYALYLSFFNWGGAGPLTFAGFSNYEALWQQPQLLSSFLHVAVLVLFFALLPIAVALLLTAVMTRSHLRGLTVYRAILFLPQVIALVAVAVVWEWILSPNGPINEVLRSVGLSPLAQDWLGSFTWALPSIGIIGSWIGYGFAMVVFMAGIDKIPVSLYEAARIDGAGPVREFLSVTLPGLRNELTVVSVMAVTGAMTTFDIVYVVTAGGPGTSTMVPAYDLYILAFTDFRVGTAAAMGVVLAILVFTIALLIMKLGKPPED